MRRAGGIVKAEKDRLTVTHLRNRLPCVSSKLMALIERVALVARQPGKKTELAQFLKVPLSRVSEWLSGVRNPSGETTLQLLEWVAGEEAQQNKMPAQMLRTSTRAAAQRRKSRETKPTSSRRKK